MDKIPWELAAIIGNLLGSSLYFARLTCRAWNSAFSVITKQKDREFSTAINMWIDAARVGNTKILDWLVKHKYKCAGYHYVIHMAISYGHVNVLERIRILVGKKLDVSMYDQVAAGRGDLAMLDYLVKHGCRIGGHCAEAAIKNGHLNVLEWMHEFHSLPTDIYGIVIDNGCDTNMLRWLYSKEISLSKNMMSRVASTGNVEAADFIHNHASREQCHNEDMIIANAAYYGHIAMIDWALANGYPIPCWLDSNAISAGHARRKAAGLHTQTT